jgi:uncharacterized membrane protein
VDLQKQRLALAGGLVTLIGALALGILAMVPGLLPRLGGGNPNRLVTMLSQTIDSKGIEAAAEQYRTLRAQGFRGVDESEADTNTLGYDLLGSGHVAAAIRILQLNVETHPNSANVYDSLGEAYLAAGNRALAIPNYEEALSRDPKSKSAAAALETLTGRKRPPYRPIVLFHILMGLLAIATGAIAMMLRKGSRSHTLVGRLFGLSMLSTSGVAAYIAFTDPQGKVVNVVMGLLTFYLVATAWRAACRRRPRSDVIDWLGMAGAATLALALTRIGLDVAAGRLSRAGAPSGVFFVFAMIAALAAVLDLRMIRRGGLAGTPRLTRHLWRMCTGLFVAVGSFFLGQPQVFPVGIRNSGLLVVPPVLVVFALGYWLLRVPLLRAWPQPLIRSWPALRRT